MEAHIAELESQLEQIKINPDSATEIINSINYLSIESKPPTPATEEVAVAGSTGRRRIEWRKAEDTREKEKGNVFQDIAFCCAECGKTIMRDSPEFKECITLLFGRKAKDGFADRMLLRAARRAAGGNVIVVVAAALPRHLRNRYSLSLSLQVIGAASQ